MAKLSEAHIEQIKSMREGSKTLKEIKDFFKATYGIKLWDGKIIDIAPKSKRAGSATVKVKRAYHRRAGKEKAAIGSVLSDDRMVKDILQLVNEIKAGYMQVFKHLRSELIRSRSEVCQMLTGAGIEPPKSKIE